VEVHSDIHNNLKGNISDEGNSTGAYGIMAGGSLKKQEALKKHELLKGSTRLSSGLRQR
jgi:hypothetical protein